jgi:hypothetical protein
MVGSIEVFDYLLIHYTLGILRQQHHMVNMMITRGGIYCTIDELWHDSKHSSVGFLHVPLLLPPNALHLSASIQL